MQIEHKTFFVDEPSQKLLHKAYFIEQIFLVLAIQIVIINLLSRSIAFMNHLLPAAMLHMRISSAIAILFATLALFCTEYSRSLNARRIGSVFALLTTLVACAGFWPPSFEAFSRFDHFLGGPQAILSRQTGLASACAFSLLGIVILLVPARRYVSGRIADACTSLLALLVLVLLSESLFEMAHIPGSSNVSLPSFPTLICLVLLTLVSVLRRAEFGIFSVFMGSGMGGRVARIVTPILLILPFLRELARARMMNAQLVPARYATAILTSVATAISFVFLLFLVRLMNGMQNEIHDLTLRDELTGLYNFRGFNLFAEQAFRLARRAKLPFGVLFVDMDNLKIINDELGHSVGSISLVETAKLLSSTFRETDVIGRLGGDEFVVAGQFDAQEISVSIDRLRSAAASKTLHAKNRFFLNLSMGFAATDAAADETLKSVVARADKAMYKDKRAKKRLIVV